MCFSILLIEPCLATAFSGGGPMECEQVITRPLSVSSSASDTGLRASVVESSQAWLQFSGGGNEEW